MEYAGIDSLKKAGMLKFDNIVVLTHKRQDITVLKYLKKYDSNTEKYYMALRKQRSDVLIEELSLLEDQAFEFRCMWDPITGERLDIDPHGPLCFDVCNLVHYFYSKRLCQLWNEEVDDVDQGYYEGHFGDGVGASERFIIKSRGEHPELYLFRLPAPNCYLEPEHDLSIITMGPKLTEEEVNDIYTKALKHSSVYRTRYGKELPNIILIKKLYDLAIAQEVNIIDAVKLGVKIDNSVDSYINSIWKSMSRKISDICAADSKLKECIIKRYIPSLFEEIETKKKLMNYKLSVNDKQLDSVIEKQEYAKEHKMPSIIGASESFKITKVLSELITIESSIETLISSDFFRAKLESLDKTTRMRLLDNIIIKKYLEVDIREIYSYINRTAVQLLIDM